MAKGKNAAALFEVINRGRQQSERRQAVTTTPSWWFKGRPTNGSSGTGANGAAGAGGGSEVAPYLKVDRDRHLISLRTTFTTGIIAACAVLVLVGVAFIWGKHMGKSGGGDEVTMAAATDADATQAAPASPAVLDVARPPASTPQAPPIVVTNESSRQSVDAGYEAPPQARPAPEPREVRAQQPAPPAAVNGPREPGLNYCVMQTYPPAWVNEANEAREVLMKNGIACTVEPAPPGYGGKGWVAVIGSTGFAQISSPEFQAYKRKVQNISVKIAGGSKFKKLEPSAFKWK